MEKKRLSQGEIIKQLSDKELMIQMYLSQGLILMIGIISSLFLIDSWYSLIELNWKQLFLFGFLPALFIVFIDFVLMRYLPERYYDDDGINKRIFTSMSYWHIPIFVLFVAIAEELLFRGVIQSTFGYIIASLTFALVHIRYLRKPVLLVSILLMSFFIGFLYEITDNLLVTIVTHFFVDLLLALLLKWKWGDFVDNKSGAVPE